MTWQPIETAPKDGRAVLVYAPGGTFGPYGVDGDDGWPEDVFMARRAPPNYLEGDAWITPLTKSDTFSGSEHTGSWTETENHRVQPTHWMPLPDPPR